MKCEKCGAEIKAGCMYCSRCGQEIRIVPDYNLFEEEILSNILEESSKKNTTAIERKNISVENRASTTGTCQKKHPAAPPNKMDPPKKKSRIGWIMGIVIAGTTLGCAITFGIMAYNNSHSFTYQFNQGLANEAAGDYERALSFLNQAKELDQKNLDVRFEISDVYLAQGKEEQAITILEEIIAMDATSKKAYKKLIDLYEEAGEYTKITALYETASTDSIKNLFSAYQVSDPIFGKKSGTYEETVKISITSPDDAKIYYTTNGKSPQQYGKLYEDPIILEKEGEYEILAICESESGLYSNEVSASYTISYTTPDAPVLTPSNGTFSDPGQMITITVPEGCNAYYIWNNAEDDTAWQKAEVVAKGTLYIEPIPIAEGNNILEVYTVSPQGKISSPVRANYIYTP